MAEIKGLNTLQSGVKGRISLVKIKPEAGSDFGPE